LDVVEALRAVQAVLYVGLAVAATRIWRRDRGRPAAYLAAAFVALGTATALGFPLRRLEPDDLQYVRDLNSALVLAFPWLLAAFAWSFTRPRLPRWLQVAGGVQGALVVTVLLLPPLGEAGDRTTTAAAFVLLAVVVWVALVVAAAVPLWRGGRSRHRVVRIRTRAMAAGAISLGFVLIASATVPQTDTSALVIALVTASAAILFGIGYVPPRALRWWWRQLPAGRIQAMQTDLIAANTPEDVAAAMAPAIAEVYGAGAIFLEPSGRVLAASGLDEEQLEDLADRVRRGEDDDRIHRVEVEGYRLAVRTSPYAPLFGDSERDLLGQFVLQIRLALQRTELQAANDAARAAAQDAYDEQQQMLVGLAHDLRSPTVTISTYSSLIADADDLEDAKQMAAGLAGSAKYLDRLVDGISELSRIGRNDGQPEPVPLTQVVEQAATRLHAAHPHLRVEVVDELPTLLVDRLRIEQVFDNLLGNAAKHGGRPDLTVTVTCEPLERGVRVVVADDGRGLPDREREEVFTLFRRGSSAGGQGSGVGLGLCRRIVEAYGGDIRFAPAEHGARAEIDLPESLLTEPCPRATEAAHAGGAHVPSEQLTPGSGGGAQQLGEDRSQAPWRSSEECGQDGGITR
jgi:signal transduction histidine kinase